MTTGERWQRNTADFLFRMFGILILLLIAEIFTDFDWKLVWAGMGVYWFLFCCFRIPNGYKRDASGKVVEIKDYGKPTRD